MTEDALQRSADTLTLFPYRHVETDSPTYAWMNNNFFIIRLVTTSNSLVPEITLYGVAEPKW